MPAALRDALRDRLTIRNGLGWIVVLALFWFLVGDSTAHFATSVVSIVVFAATDLLEDVYDLRGWIREAGLGAYALVGGAAMLAFADGSAWLPVAFLLVGCWFVLDAVQTVRHEGATVDDDPRDGQAVYRDYVARRVHETVRERPRTRRELADALDADEEAVEAALDRLVERGALERAGSEYRVGPDTDPDWPTRAYRWVGALARRVARPATLEFADDGADEDSDVDRTGEGAGNGRDRSAGTDCNGDETGRATATDSDEEPA